MLVSENAKVYVTPNANPHRVGHVHFTVVVSISFTLGSQFPVKYGNKENTDLIH